MSYEWPLLVFTFPQRRRLERLFAQVARSLFSRDGSEEANRALFLPLLAASPVVLCIGLVASLMHLGQVVGAPSALLNIGSSWLSRDSLRFPASSDSSSRSWSQGSHLEPSALSPGGIYGNQPCFSRERGQRVPASHRSVVEHDGNASFDDRGAVMAGCAVVSAFVLVR